ncbi:MAG: DEAD/DEAH box helicase family protein, partial [Nannocystaceae bacterium]
FLKWSGFRLIERDLRGFLERRPGQLRVLTTAYMRATQARALEELCALGADVRVSYDTQRTRLHAKAWMFHRRSGFSTAFVGSSNLSAAALLDGTEWNVRLSQRDNAGILRRFQATFDQYWNDPEFRRYDRDEFQRALGAQANEAHRLMFRFEIEPRPHQQEILDDLASERARGYLRNLVVAATGTGKTVVAALDYKRLREQLPRARLLFVAHRRELLEQSLMTYRVVLKDGDFGELHVGGDRPVHGKHVFASIQSLHARGVDGIDPQAFDIVVVDEFHHAAAPSYARLLKHLRPNVLLGLTATPERTDGHSVLGWFDNRTASELRLWKALDQELLCPFQYFGIGGAPNAGGVRWSRGRYDSRQLSNLYTADHVFAMRVVQEVHAKVADVAKMRGLGFCVDVAHAKFMEQQFVKAGIAAAAVFGSSSRDIRTNALRALQARELNVVFCVDLFNEGVDVPEVDTVLFLRPTESATVFLQQLGRGLRRSHGKECLTVLDFIGGANRKFRFDRRFRAILG